MPAHTKLRMALDGTRGKVIGFKIDANDEKRFLKKKDGFSRSKIDSEDHSPIVTAVRFLDSSYESDAVDKKPVYRPPAFLIIPNILFWIGLFAWWFWPT